MSNSEHLVATNLGEFVMQGGTDANGPYVSIRATTDKIEVAFLDDFIAALRAEAAKVSQ